MAKGILRSDAPYLTLGERRMFQLARRSGEVSFFQTAACVECKSEIPKNDKKKYCSEQCYQKATGEDNASPEEE